jgi:leader peptidase (prepilin peptidase)/N-methyltransferase
MFSPVLDAVSTGILGLLVGSFLNVVIHRLPRMLERQWAAECADLAGKERVESEHVSEAVQYRLLDRKT